jgi:nitrite reductase/ring-hydroxylating ferredoxin subunit
MGDSTSEVGRVACPHCGHEEPAGTRFCTACGRAMDAGGSKLGRVASVTTRPILWAVLGVSALIAFVIVAFFLLPPPYLKVPDIQRVVRVARLSEFPEGTSRMVTWGERSVLVVRRDTDAFFAVQGTAPSDGCFLEWDAEALRIESPCTYVVYDLDGNVVEGLSQTPLQRFRVFEHDGTLYVTEA